MLIKEEHLTQNFVFRTRNSLTLHHEDGGRMDLRNVGILPQHYTASQARTPRLDTQVLMLKVRRIVTRRLLHTERYRKPMKLSRGQG